MVFGRSLTVAARWRLARQRPILSQRSPGFLSRTLIRMYCRNCHYDLRGQENLRCPECGTRFDNEDASSFYDSFPTRRARLRFWATRRRWALSVILTIVVVSYLIGSTKHFPPFWKVGDTTILLSYNLKGILVDWATQRNDHPDQRAFDVEAARASVRKSFSVHEQPQACRHRKCMELLRQAPWFGIPLAIYGLLLMWLFSHQSLRRIFAILCVTFLLSILAANKFYIASLFWSPSHRYLEDFVYLDNADWLRDTGLGTIVAYEKPSGRARECIGYEAGNVICSLSERLDPRLRKLGLDRLEGLSGQDRP
jgi:hypothetical protein